MFKNTSRRSCCWPLLGALFMGVGVALRPGRASSSGSSSASSSCGGSYWFSDKIAVSAAGAQPVTEDEAPQLYAIVRDLDRSAPSMPMPRVYISPAHAAQRLRHRPQPAARGGRRHPGPPPGRSTRTSCAACSPTRSRTCATATSSSARSPRPSRSASRSSPAWRMWGAIFGGGGGDRDRDGNIFGLLAMVILAPMAAALLQMALSRSREFEADRSGAELLGTGEPLARRSRRSRPYAKQVPMDVDPAHATAYIINPLTGRKVELRATCSAPTRRPRSASPVCATSTRTRSGRSCRAPTVAEVR